jgi:hypothetical protein
VVAVVSAVGFGIVGAAVDDATVQCVEREPG